MKDCKVSLYGLCLLLVAFLLPMIGYAQGGGYYSLSQGETRVEISPLEDPASAVDFYSLEMNRSNTGLEGVNTATFFLYEDTTAGTVSLFLLLGGEGGTAGTTAITLSGIPVGADFVVKDDEIDTRDSFEVTPPTGSLAWTWDEGNSDGAVLAPLGPEFEVTLYPQFTSGITSVKFLSGSIAGPQAIDLNLVDPMIVKGTQNLPPIVTFSALPTDPYVNEPVTFDASGSVDPDGSIITYEWDLDGDGIFEVSTGKPVVTYSYPTSGVMLVTLQATDDGGAAARYTYEVPGTRARGLPISELSVKVRRTISTIQALPGTTFKVVVRIETEMDLAGAGLQENLPVGWKIKPLENAGAAFKRAAVQWVFIDKIKAGTSKVIAYEVTVPDSQQLIATTLPVCFGITGVFQAITPELQLPVEGDEEIEVTDALRIKTAIAHLVPRIGEDMEDTVDLRLSQRIDPVQLARALEMWHYDEPVPWTQGATIDLWMMKELAAYAYTCTPVDLPLPLAPAANINAVRTIATPVPCRNVLLNYYGRDGSPAGNKFTVKVEIWADQDLYGVGLDEDLPTGWLVTPIEHHGFTYKPSRIQWVLPDKLPVGTCKTIIYQVEVPQTQAIETPSSDPCYVSTNDLFGMVDSALPCQEVPVTGDSAVDVSDCLSVIAAISRWNVEDDTIDITLSDKISFRQVQRAIAFWLEDEMVPWTCRNIVSYELLKTIIAYWLTNSNICEPLPGSVQDPCDPDAVPCVPPPAACSD